MSVHDKRSAKYSRNSGLEDLLQELSELLAPAEEAALLRARERAERRWPILLIVGPPRSGTTLLMQWLATSGAFAYPTNLLSRFFAAPAIGARVQQLLTDPAFAYRDELEGLAPAVDFRSDLGKTKGPLAPNEFWYFWRRFLPIVDIEPMGERTSEVDADSLNAELQAVADVFEKPFAAKGLMWNYDLAAAARAMPDAIFLHLVRDPLFNAQSLLESRERFFGDRQQWYSVRPPEAAALDRLSPPEQVIGQVVHTQRHIAAGLADVEPKRQLRIDYEAFCREPAAAWQTLRDCLAHHDCELPGYAGPERFETPDALRLSDEDVAALRDALSALEG